MQAVSSGVEKLGFGVNTVTLTVKSGISSLMSLAGQAMGETPPPSGLFCVSFNQDFTSLGVGTQHGYKLYTISSVDKIEETCDNAHEDTCIVERLFSSSLVAIVSISSPRKLKVCHFKKHSEICNYSYPNTILSVKLNRQRLIVCLEESLFIHNIRDMKVIHIIRDTPPNVRGLFSLSTSNDNLLAYPISSTVGQVQIFDTSTMQSKAMILAHEGPLAALSFNEPGTKIATASEKGTVIRVFNVSDGSKLYELRRGIKRCADIYSLSFSSNSLFLICSSNTETVHIFKLEESQNTQPLVPDDQPGFMGFVSGFVSGSAQCLPTPVTDIFSQERAFATITLPFQGIKNTCAVSYIQKEPRVLVASADGFLYIYSLNTTEGGECQLLKQHRLDTNISDVGNSSESSSTTNTSNCPPASKPLDTDTNTSGSPNNNNGGSYAKAVVKGSAHAPLTEAEKMSEMAAAMETPPEDTLKLNDDDEYPPMGGS